MRACIKGAAEDVSLHEVTEVCHDIDRILLPTDGSAPSIAATEFAMILAKAFDAEIRAIYVDTGMEALEYPEEIEDDRVFEGAHPSIKGLAIAKTMCDRNGVVCNVEVVRGGVAKRIVAISQEWDADLIVCGDTGRTGLKRLALGSVAETVVKGSDVPVLVVKSD